MGPYTKPPWKYYVYVWVDVNGLYYVGKGRRRRGWDVHFGTGNKPSKAQKRREQFNRSFRCMVVHDGMSSEAALNLESMLICRLQPSCNLLNKRGLRSEGARKAYQDKRRRQLGIDNKNWIEKGEKALEIQAGFEKRLSKSLADHVKEREAAKLEQTNRLKRLDTAGSVC